MNGIELRGRREFSADDDDALRHHLESFRDSISRVGGAILATKYFGKPGSANHAVVVYQLPLAAWSAATCVP